MSQVSNHRGLPRGTFSDAGGMRAWIEESVATCRDRLGGLFDWSAGERRFLGASVLGAPPE